MSIPDVSGADFSGRERPDACPGALQVHEAADGPLARVRLPGGAISPAQLRELAACAAELGSGEIELTSRANVQVRGLRSPAAFAERIAAAGLLPSAAHERVRNIVASPLGGRGPAGLLDPQPLVRALDRELCTRPRLAELPGRFLFALDDGTGEVAGLGADVTFAAGRGLLLAGADAGVPAGPETVVSLMIAAAEAFLDEREDADGGAAWRIRELADGPARIAARLRSVATAPALPAPTTQRAGVVAQPDGHARGARGGRARQAAGFSAQRDGRMALEVVVALGRLSAAQAQALADSAGILRLTPWRTVVLLDLSPADADRAARALDAAGLVSDPASPWVGVTACTGRPGCAKALADVQADARRWVATLDGPPKTPVHWAGCERRCGLPRGQVVQLIATEEGYQERQQ
ncbi:precorrin-3B synthase [Nonomuraea sp. M3C6]|uniref:Precorrin-3B synthase n=1 Tax=Nonomuraea marmarensis TaxID=3351344 RepID=A0ABW7AD44_9ACTN